MKTNNYQIFIDDLCNHESVEICIGECDYLKSFISIFIDDGSGQSPFKTVEDAKLFAEIIVKLLKVIKNGND